MYILRLKMERNSFFGNSILTMMSKQEHEAMKTCFSKVHMRFDAN